MDDIPENYKLSNSNDETDGAVFRMVCPITI